MSDKEKEEKEKTPFKIISSDTSVELPNEGKDENDAVKDLLALLKPKVEAPKPVAPKPLSIGAKNLPVTFKPIQKPVTTPTKMPAIPAKEQAPEVESEILVDEVMEGEDVSEDLMKMSSILKEIKEEEIADRVEEKPTEEIPDKVILGIQIECPHCGRKILLDRLEYLKYGYSDYCPHCNLMILPNILPEDYEPPPAPDFEE